MEQREAVVRAWVCFDPDAADGWREDADAVDGWTVGVKDIFDTADFPTEYGSAIYMGHQPRADAGAVALLRAAGAVIVGKTVTAELAMFYPGPTTNPHRSTHTPGGSSSGSAAAVAAGMCDVALGTQTGGSVIRPASFCGVLGFKPTFGSVTTAGVKFVAPSLDTVGWFARDVAGIDKVRVALTGRPAAPNAAPRFALARTEQWDAAGDDSQSAVLAAAEQAGAADVDLPVSMLGLAAEQPIVQAYEAARALAWERTNCGEMLSDNLREILDWGAAVPADDYDHVRARARAVDPDEIFGDAEVLLTPAVVGEAPEGLQSTGDPRFCRMWNLLGWPAISVPGFTGSTGLPVGVQVVGRPGHDAEVIAAARCLEGAWS